MLLALCFSAEAQQPKKVSRIGYLSAIEPASESTRSEAILNGLRDLGYKDRTLPSNTDIRRERLIGRLNLRPNWCVSRLMLSW